MKKITAITILLAMALAILPFTFASAESISYVDASGNPQGRKDCKPVAQTMTTGWYYVDSDRTFDKRMEVSGDVNLILRNYRTLNAKGGIHIPNGSKLTIWAQSQNSAERGRLSAVNPYFYAAGIGTNELNGTGEIVINGGRITATGSQYEDGEGFRDGGPGIGCRKVTINAGAVYAYGRG